MKKEAHIQHKFCLLLIALDSRRSQLHIWELGVRVRMCVRVCVVVKMHAWVSVLGEGHERFILNTNFSSFCSSY